MARSEIGEWMPFEIDRFFGSPRVGQMRDFQKWWYVSLLLRAWQAQPPCHLPDDENELMIMAGATDETSWKKHSALVLGAFRATGNGYRVNARQLEIYEEKIGIREVNRLNGLKGGRPKKTESKPNGNQTVSGSSNSSSDSVLAVALKEERFVLPIWVPEVAWLAYLQMRHKKRADPTENAKRLICKKLEKWMNQGQSVEEILYQSVTSNWTDVYELKESYGTGQNNSRGRQSAGQARTERTRSVLTEVLRERHGDSALAGPDLPSDQDRDHLG